MVKKLFAKIYYDIERDQTSLVWVSTPVSAANKADICQDAGELLERDKIKCIKEIITESMRGGPALD